MIGNSRCGKSTLLNAILYFCTEKQNIQERININEPFKTSDEVEGCTKDFEYMKMSLNSKDIFLVDSEGFKNLNGVSRKAKMGLLVLQSIVDIILLRVEQTFI